jgi:hypothetical protein
MLTDGQILNVRLHLQATPHQLSVRSADGRAHKFALMNRQATPTLIDALTRHFGARFEKSTTSTFALLNRYAPFLML